MPRAIVKTLVVTALLFAAVSCGYDTSTTFNADGTVTVGMKFLFPKSLMQGANGATALQGMAPADVAKANAQMSAKYPGAKISVVTEGDQTGAQILVPFKTEKAAFAFLTTPSKLSLAGAATGSSSGVDLSNTGGLFSTATHTTSGQTDTYTFTTAPPPMASPSPGTQQVMTGDELSSIFTLTFSLTVPHEITSADGALFTLDRKTAIWKISFTKPETLTATTGPAIVLTGLASTPSSQGGSSSVLVGGVGLVAILLGFVLGMLLTRRRTQSLAVAPAPLAPAVFAPNAPAPIESSPMEPMGAYPGPPAGLPPPPGPPVR